MWLMEHELFPELGSSSMPPEIPGRKSIVINEFNAPGTALRTETSDPSEPGPSEGHSVGRRISTESLVWYRQKTHKCFIRPPRKKRKIKTSPNDLFWFSHNGKIINPDETSGRNEDLPFENLKTPCQNPFSPIWSCESPLLCTWAE